MNKLTLMKTKLIILIGSALAIAPLGAEDKPAPSPAAQAKGPGGPGAPGGPKGKGDGSFFREMDTDGDKAISKEEAGERWERLGKLDKYSDGKVTMQEMMAARPQGGPEGKGAPQGGPGKGGPEMFANADKNKDGKLSKDEVPAEMWERLSKLDKDSDGAVSKEEMAAMRGKGGPEGGPAPMFSRFDEDKDGKLSKSEVPAEMWEKLSKADDDADGFVSKAELEKVFHERGGKGEGPRPVKKPEA